ncbi:MAG: DNA-3-methyladenine glycosylase 2 family protein [Burkholderiaceae bacterium]|nr:DNA-3-methyladenine glycosylase 2 family protein [Burkholderiaceae bacterium]
MLPDPDAAYLALKARDARFDGRLFVGVTSTGIYCRPVCRVRTPRRENCRFFASAAQAEAQAFRPCLKCRPEIAPGLSVMDSSAALADAAARAIEHGVHAGEAVSIAAVAARLGVTDRHLRRIFTAAHGVGPQDYETTQRLLLAKRLLTDTDEPVAQVALASGFGSLRRFNAAFAQRYRMPPTRLRREGAAPRTGDPLRLAWRPPCDVTGLLRFHAQRALPGVEAVDGLVLRRTLRLPSPRGPVAGWLACRMVPNRHELWLEPSPSLAPTLGGLLQRVRHAFDLDADPARIDPVLAALPHPAPPGLRLPGSFDGFETAVRVILGQQVTVQAARTLAQRLVAAFGTPVPTPFPGLNRLFPDAATLAAADPADIGRLGIVRQRVRALQALAAEVAAGRLALHPGAPLQPTLDALRALPGVGEWTTQLIALRVLGWPDAFPATDIGLLNALRPALGARDATAATRLAEAWQPWRGYAVIALWQTLETPT